MLDSCLRAAEINRSSIYITNVVPIRPRDNKIENLKELGLRWEDFLPSLKTRLIALQPHCIVALGATALNAVCGISEVTSWRGSILQSSLVPGLKVIPSFHPSYVQRLGDKLAREEVETKGSGGVIYDYGSSRVSLCLDLRRAKEESRSGIYSPESFDFVVVDTPGGVRELVRNLLYAPQVSFDIETRGSDVVSVAFAVDGQFASVVPLDDFWLGGSRAESLRILGELFVEHEGLVAQNGIFDIIMLLQHFPIKRLHFDTMVAHHTIYPELPHALDFLTSVYTRFPYYKWMRVTGNKETFLKYNALDAIATFQVAQRLKEELVEYGLVDFFYGFVMPLWHCVFRMGLRGILVNNEAKEELDKVLEAETETLQQRFYEKIGKVVNVRSSPQLQEFLYEDLGLAKQFHRKTYKATVDEDALEKLAKKNPVVRDILEIRGKLNERSKLTKAKLDEDNRARTQYSQSVTDTGRLSSKKTLWKTGLNLQNVPREEHKRKMFVADPGFVLMRYDKAQAEARLVAWFARDEKLKKFLLEGGDIHVWNASLVFNKDKKNVSKEERYFAKRCVHGFNYGLGPTHLVDMVRTEFKLEWTRSDATRVRDSYFRNSPRILAWHEEIREVMNTTRTLVNPFGRRRTFFGRPGDDLHRKMVAFLPQSSCVDDLNHAMIRIDLRLPEPAVHLLQVHDEGVLQCLPEQVEEIVTIIKEESLYPIVIYGDPLVIPVEIKIGSSWGEGKELKQ